MKNKKTKIINAIVFIVLIIATFYVIFKKNDMHEILRHIMNVDKKFIVLGLFVMLLFSACEAFNIYSVLKSLGEKTKYKQALKYAFVGFFFSSITPSSTGGQPLQLYFMSKDKIPASHSLIALIVELFSFQLAVGITAILGFVLHHKLLLSSIGNLKYLVFLGLSINIIILISLLILLFSKKLALKIIKGIYKFLKFIHFKKSDSFYENSLKQIDEYHDSAIFLKNHKTIIYKTLIVSLIQMFFYHSIPYFVYLSFGLREYSIIEFASLQAVLYIAVSSLPLPGAMGVSEGSFVILFKLLFPASILSSAMLISRGISFYLYTFITGIIIVAIVITKKIKETRKNNN